MNLVWIAVIVAFGVTEAVTAGLVCVWFAVGAAGALIASVLGFRLAVQLWTFALVSAAALAVTRPLARKLAVRAMTPTNADRLLGGVGKVTETVDASGGAVYADGKIWTARSADGSVIPVEARVTVERIEGVKLFVKKSEQEAAV